MLEKFQTKNGLVSTGIASILFAIILLNYNSGFWWFRTDVNKHVCALQIFCSAMLIIGAIKSDKKLLIPWITITVMFVYILIYGAINESNMNHFEGLIGLAIIFVFIAMQCCGLYGALKAYENMRNDVPPTYQEFASKAWQAAV